MIMEKIQKLIKSGKYDYVLLRQNGWSELSRDFKFDNDFGLVVNLRDTKYALDEEDIYKIKTVKDKERIEIYLN